MLKVFARSMYSHFSTLLIDDTFSMRNILFICLLLVFQTGQGGHAHGSDASCSGAGTESSPFVCSTSHQFHSGIPHLVGSCRLDSLSEHPSLMRAPAQNEHGHNLPADADQRHSVAGPCAHFCHSISDPGSSSVAHHHKLDYTFDLPNSRSLLCMPASHPDQSNRAQHNQQVLHPSSLQNEHPTFHSGFDNGFHNSNHSDSAGNPLLPGNPECSQQFHLQQLPTGVYDPELGMDENPYYFSVNQMLYEAHLCRVRRDSGFPNST